MKTEVDNPQFVEHGLKTAFPQVSQNSELAEQHHEFYGWHTTWQALRTSIQWVSFLWRHGDSTSTQSEAWRTIQKKKWGHDAPVCRAIFVEKDYAWTAIPELTPKSCRARSSWDALTHARRNWLRSMDAVGNAVRLWITVTVAQGRRQRVTKQKRALMDWSWLIEEWYRCFVH
jgi:hypothetical protein